MFRFSFPERSRGIVQSRHLGIALVILLVSFVAARATLEVAFAPPNAQKTLSACVKETNNTVAAENCLREAIRDLLAVYSTPQLMNATGAYQLPQNIRGQCHAIGHIIGEETFKKTRSLETALSACTNDCRSACLHGALTAAVLETMGGGYDEEDIAHADTETLTKMGKLYCDRSIVLCHGLGHIAYITAEALQDALVLCNSIASGFTAEACYQGIFMERTGTSDAATPFVDDIPYEIRDGDYTYPCLDIDQKYRHACFQTLAEFQLPLLENADIADPREHLSLAIRVCDALEGRERAYCFEGIGVESTFFGFRTFDEKELQPLCDQLPRAPDRASCTLGVLTKYFFIDEYATRYCDNIAEEERRSICYDGMFSWSERFGYSCTTQAGNFCACGGSQMCIAQQKIYEATSDTMPDYRFGLYGAPSNYREKD